MTLRNNGSVSKNSPYNGGLTREQFLFHEMRITARLLFEGYTDGQVIEKIVQDNLFQFPTEKSVRNLARVCLRRLHAMNDDSLVAAIAAQPSDTAKQICLYAVMKQNRLVWDFMITVIGEKYRQMDMSFGKIDVNAFLMRLQEQDDSVATWSESTIKKIKSVLVSILVENGYLDSNRSDTLIPVLLDRDLETAIRGNNDDAALPAFNCFG